MGFNLIRWFTDEQYKAVKQYKRYQDRRPLAEDYPEASGGIVFDVGGYDGAFAIRSERELDAKVFCFEPVQEFQELIAANIADKKNVRLRRYGLSNTTRSAMFSIQGLGTGEARGREGVVCVELQDVHEAINTDAPEGIDLLAMNVEGAEYEILTRLFETGDIHKIRHLRIQFHLTVEDAREKYRIVSQQLSKTHELVWRYPFIWESWSRKTLPKKSL